MTQRKMYRGKNGYNVLLVLLFKVAWFAVGDFKDTHHVPFRWRSRLPFKRALTITSTLTSSPNCFSLLALYGHRVCWRERQWGQREKRERVESQRGKREKAVAEGELEKRKQERDDSGQSIGGEEEKAREGGGGQEREGRWVRVAAVWRGRGERKESGGKKRRRVSVWEGGERAGKEQRGGGESGEKRREGREKVR
jgi:hypothetical protein